MNGKRTFDVVVSSAGLIVLAPALAVVAAAVKLDSRGPVLFVQQRVGRAGRPFGMLKFRTMVVAAGRTGVNVSPTGDPRITRVGTLLRRCFLDEAPQLLNVLRGDMSLVGPRPETPDYAALLSTDERRILSVRPGMAGPSTLAYSAAEPAMLAEHDDPDRFYRDHLLHVRVRADLEYLDRAGLAEDIRILARTAAVVLSGAGITLRRRPGARPPWRRACDAGRRAARSWAPSRATRARD
jgi:lipopolysaccharide/colanic/teichoic acid biosynthesis glycosyltransferase